MDLRILLVAGAGVLGLVIGSFLNVVAYRVPAGIALRGGSSCPHCDAKLKPRHNLPVIGWLLLRGRCAACGERISVRDPIVEVLTGFAFAGVSWWVLVGGIPSRFARSTTGEWTAVGVWATAIILVAFLYLAAISIVLTLIDIDVRRLPNSIVLPSYLIGAALLTLASWLTEDWPALLRSAIGMATLYAFYLVLRLVRPGGMGGGDVKLAGVLGLYLGWVGWGALAVGAFAAFLIGGVWGAALILARKAARKTAIPFGPFMIFGAWAGLLAGDAIARWYVDLFLGV